MPPLRGLWVFLLRLRPRLHRGLDDVARFAGLEFLHFRRSFFSLFTVMGVFMLTHRAVILSGDGLGAHP